MNVTNPTAVVFDCTVFAQALINPSGPAGACLTAAQVGRLKLFVSDYVIQEVRELPVKLPPRLGVTAERVEGLVRDLATYVEPVADVPEEFTYDRDPDDAHYVNLALAAAAYLIVTRDKDLLDLMNDANPDGVALRARHPAFRVLTPPALLGEIGPAMP